LNDRVYCLPITLQLLRFCYPSSDRDASVIMRDEKTDALIFTPTTSTW